MSADFRLESLDGDRALQHSFPERPMIGYCAEIVLLAITGRNRLRIEVIGVDVIDALRSNVQSRGDVSLRRENEIELSEGVDALLFGGVVGKRQRAVGNLAKVE